MVVGDGANDALMLGQAGLGLQDLTEALGRPATSRQFGIELRVPAGPDQLCSRAQHVPRPDSLGQVRWQAVNRIPRGCAGRNLMSGQGAVEHDDTVHA